MAELRAPRFSPVDDSYPVLEWLVADGTEVAAGQPVVVVETAKALEELVAEQAGRLQHRVPAGRHCAVGDVLGVIAPAGVVVEPPVQAPPGDRPDDAPAPGDATSGGPAVTAPALQLAAELGIPEHVLRRLPGRVVRAADVRALAAAGGAAPPGPARDGTELPLPPGQAAVAAAVGRSHATVPSAFLVMEVDVEAALAWGARQRRRLRAMVGLTELLVLALGAARDAHPLCFASAEDPDAPRVAPGAHVGVTLDAGHGLVVPVVRDAHRLGAAAVAAELARLRAEVAQEAAGRGLTARDLVGANVMLALAPEDGVLVSRPILFPGQTCAVSLPAVHRTLVLSEHGVQQRRRVHLGLCYDHRLVNGRQAAALLGFLRDWLQDPPDAEAASGDA